MPQRGASLPANTTNTQQAVRLNYGRTCCIGLAFMGISAFWQVYDTVVPLILKNTFALGDTLTGAVMAADNVLAVLLLPLLGAWSDRIDTRLGKRTPFILAGMLLSVLFMLLIPIADNARNLPLFVAGLGAVLVSMALYRSPAVGVNVFPVVVDMCSNDELGKYTGLYYTFSMAAQIATPIASGFLLEHVSYMTLFPYAAAFCLLGLLAITQVRHGDPTARQPRNPA